MVGAPGTLTPPPRRPRAAAPIPRPAPSLAPQIIERAKDKADSFRLMGFGHRVYKTFDPRATLMRAVTYRVLERLGIKDPLLDIAMELEKVALRDEYFVKR